MASISTNKRRRTAADTLRISDLPIGFIVDVSAYLPKPSKAILAVAFSAPSSSWKNDNLMHHLSPISTAIVSAQQQWDILDFEDVDKELANKLTDDDINAIMNCINAQDVLKRLKLCGCINITGIGLNPLRGSVVLEQIDLSLVGKHENLETVDPESKISQELVISILDSIISSDGCSLKYTKFPQEWRGNVMNGLTVEFRERYIRSFDERGLSCTSCYTAIQGEGAYSSGWLSFYGYQNKMCYDCLKPFCDQCVATDATDNEDSVLRFCHYCEKDYCTDCDPCAKCAGCDNFACQGCRSDRCDGCAKTWCKGCPNMFRCILCKKTVCTKCSAYEESYMRECPTDDFACEPCNERLW